MYRLDGTDNGCVYDIPARKWLLQMTGILFYFWTQASGHTECYWQAQWWNMINRKDISMRVELNLAN